MSAVIHRAPPAVRWSYFCMACAILVVVALVPEALIWTLTGNEHSTKAADAAQQWDVQAHRRHLQMEPLEMQLTTGHQRERRILQLQRHQQHAHNLLAVEVAGMQLLAAETTEAHASYSTYSCTGLQWGEERYTPYGCPYCRTCRFTGVCLNHTSLNIQFYPGAKSTGPLFYDPKGEPHYTFPTDFVSTAHVHISPSHLDWAPTVVPGDIPPDAVFSDAPVAAYASLNDFAFNFGHALFDFLFPVFNVLQLLNLYTPSFQLLLADHQGTDPSVAKHFIAPSDPDRSLLALISRRPAMTKRQMADATRDANAGRKPLPELTCFSTLVAGSGSLQATMQRTRALPFRSAALVNMGFAVEPALGQAPPMITMLKKNGKRLLENADEAMDHLQSRFPNATYHSVQGDAIASMSIKDQMDLMSRTSILITPCGGIGTVLTFLQPGATAIVMNYWQNVKNVSVQMEAIYYWNLEYLDLQYFPVILEDYDNTTDRPQCEKKPHETHYEEQGAFIACNVRLKTLQRLEDTVGNALRRWAVRHKQDAAAYGA